MATGAAIVGGIGAVGSIVSGNKQAGAARSAAATQANSAQLAEEGINRRFDETQETLRPAIEVGNLARDQQTDLLGLNGEEAQQASVNQISESPAQQFLRNRAQKNLLQNAAAIGGVGGGDVRTALVEQGVGFALQDTENQFRRLNNLSAAGTATAVQQGQFGANAANAAGNAIIQGGQATASGTLGAAQAKANGFAGFTQGVGQVIGSGAFNTSSAPPPSNNQFLQPVRANTNIGFL